MKWEIIERQQQAIQNHMEKVQSEAEDLKRAKMDNWEMIEMQKREEYLKKTSIKQMIWNQERSLEEQKR